MAGTSDKVKGRTKVAVGAATGDKSLESEGRIDRFTGEIKDKLGDVTDSLEAWIDQASDKAGDALQSGRRKLDDLLSRN